MVSGAGGVAGGPGGWADVVVAGGGGGGGEIEHPKAHLIISASCSYCPYTHGSADSALQMEYLDELLKLPYQTLVLLAAGYLSYRIAYVGRDSTHTTIDTIAIMLVFSGIAQASTAGAFAVYQKISGTSSADPMQLWLGYAISFSGLILSLFAASIWRWFGAQAVADSLRFFGISSADRHVSAWQSVIDREQAGPSTITVVRKDGSMVCCDRLADYSDAPLKSLILGQDGSVALYVTSSKDVNADEWTGQDPHHGDWGPELTVVPAEEVREIRIRHSPQLRKRWWNLRNEENRKRRSDKTKLEKG